MRDVWGMVSLVRGKVVGRGDSTDRALTELGVIKLTAEKVSAFSGWRVGGVFSGEGDRVGEGRSGILKMEKGQRKMVESVVAGADHVNVVAPEVIQRRTEVKCSAAVVGPSGAGVRRVKCDAQLARWVARMGSKVERGAVYAGPG